MSRNCGTDNPIYERALVQDLRQRRERKYQNREMMMMLLLLCPLSSLASDSLLPFYPLLWLVLLPLSLSLSTRLPLFLSLEINSPFYFAGKGRRTEVRRPTNCPLHLRTVTKLPLTGPPFIKYFSVTVCRNDVNAP